MSAAFVNSATLNGSGFSGTIGLNVTGGNFLWCEGRLGDDTGTDTLTINDNTNAGNFRQDTYKALTGLGTLATQVRENTGGNASFVATLTQSVSSSLRGILAQFSGIATSSTLDVSDNGATGNSATPTSNSITPTATGELIISGMAGNTGTPTVTAGTGYTLDQTIGNDKAVDEYNLSGSNSATTASYNLTLADDFIVSIAAYKLAGGGPPAVQQTLMLQGMGS